MEHHCNTIIKRKRIHSPKPTTLLREAFEHKYVNHLVPALVNIRDKGSWGSEKSIRFEVDNALASSTEGFAWSRALKKKLQPGVNAVKDAASSSFPSSKSIRRRRRLQRGGEKKEREEVQFKERLMNLRRVLPGGDEMNANELLTEVGSYLVALETQVKVLRCLLETH